MVSKHDNSRDPATPSQSIPLQNLSRPPDDGDGDGEEEWRRIRRQLSGRVAGGTRSILGNRRSFNGRINTAGRYERVGAGEHPHEENNSLEVPHNAAPRNAHQPITFYDDDELSPVNVNDFHNASMGLSFDDPSQSQPTISITPNSARRTTLGVITEAEAVSPILHPVESSANDNDGYFSSADSDRTPLTDQRYLQPISGSQFVTPTGQPHDRHSRRSSRSSPGARLGDNLSNTENGLQIPGGRSINRISSLSSKSLARSLSTSVNPLSGAGTLLRQMSQRVVNLSNEPEIVEQMVRRKSSARQARLEGPPSFPMMTEYAHDEPSRTPPSFEKDIPLVQIGQPRETWRQPPNPLKGRSLMTFAPDNRLRLWLCELLVHRATEPVILILIIFQTIILAVGAAQPLAYDLRSAKLRANLWGSSWIDYCLLGLFIIYTLEIMARIVVSGFVINAPEYSTLDQSIGLRQAIWKQWRFLFTSQPQSRFQQKAAQHTDPQRSILRSFTSMQGQADQPGNSRQQQRVRLARRAFLRHSFNRLDFLAVVSFWIAFIFSNLGFEPNKGVYVFQMMSCLRILRLLVLTSGTTVSICHLVVERLLSQTDDSPKS